MRLYTGQHLFYCGVDLHPRSMYPCVLDAAAQVSRFGGCGEFLSYCRLVRCSHESNGKKLGSGGHKIGNAHLKWAFCEALALMLRECEEVKRRRDRLDKKHGKSVANAALRRKLGRAVYHMLHRHEAFDMKKFLTN